MTIEEAKAILHGWAAVVKLLPLVLVGYVFVALVVDLVHDYYGKKRGSK